MKKDIIFKTDKINIKSDKMDSHYYFNVDKCHKASCKEVNSIYMKCPEELKNHINGEARIATNNHKIDIGKISKPATILATL